MSRSVVVTTGSRLHFGLFAFGRTAGRQYGGVGAMVAQPTVQLRLTPGRADQCSGPLAERVAEYLAAVRQAWPWAAAPVHASILHAPPDHVGLGTGTQVGLAVAAGISALFDQPIPDAGKLSQVVGRAKRSAIGTYGFLQGGLLLESGKSSSYELSPLAARVELPDAWRFLIVRPRAARGLSGAAESQAFAELPPVPPDVEDELRGIATDQLLPAAQQADFSAFTSVLRHYSRLAGNCYAPYQGGIFANKSVARIADHLEAFGAQGVGQSSWGPSLFALVPEERAADQIALQLVAETAEPLEVTVAAPLNRGASLIVREELS